jgi:hypothetical protein
MSSTEGTMLHFMTTHSVSVLSTVTWFNTTKRTHCCVSMAQFYIKCTCPVVFIVHIHAYRTPISVFCRYENLNYVCSVMIWCSFPSCVVICFVCCSQMCWSTYILWTAAPVNWRVSHTDDWEHWFVTFTSCQRLYFISLMFFSRKNQSTQKSEEKEANCGIPTLKAKVLLFSCHEKSLKLWHCSGWPVTVPVILVLLIIYYRSAFIWLVNCVSDTDEGLITLSMQKSSVH